MTCLPSPPPPQKASLKGGGGFTQLLYSPIKCYINYTLYLFVVTNRLWTTTPPWRKTRECGLLSRNSTYRAPKHTKDWNCEREGDITHTLCENFSKLTKRYHYYLRDHCVHKDYLLKLSHQKYSLFQALRWWGRIKWGYTGELIKWRASFNLGDRIYVFK